MDELDLVASQLEQATCPEDVFGDLPGTPEEQKAKAKQIFRKMSRVVHPDVNHGNKRAEAAFKTLNEQNEAAEKKINAGTYGDRNAGVTKVQPVMVKTRRQTYIVGDMLAQGDLTNLYACTFVVDGVEQNGIFKVPRDPSDNDFTRNEARILRRLADGNEYTEFSGYIPRLVESFGYKDTGSATRQTNVLAYHADVPSPNALYSLIEVRKHYDQGVDPRNMVWIFKRLLRVMSFAHANGVLHGAILPTHVLVEPVGHGVILIDWSYAVLEPAKSGERISAISAEYESWYPQEVFAKEGPRPGLDVYMAAKTMVYLLGGDPIKGTMPNTVHASIQGFLRACMIPNPRQRLQEISGPNGLYMEFNRLLERVYGPPRFFKLEMPTRR